MSEPKEEPFENISSDEEETEEANDDDPESDEEEEYGEEPREDEEEDGSEIMLSKPEPVVHVEQEPSDLEVMSLMDEESLLVSNDTLNIHTSPYLTKYEMTKVLALRSQQISTGAPPTVAATDFPSQRYPMDPYSIALMELKMNRLPLIIGRRLPNNTIIRIPVNALLIPNM